MTCLFLHRTADGVDRQFFLPFKILRAWSSVLKTNKTRVLMGKSSIHFSRNYDIEDGLKVLPNHAWGGRRLRASAQEQQDTTADRVVFS